MMRASGHFTIVLVRVSLTYRGFRLISTVTVARMKAAMLPSSST
jgi:hypothetical protein